MIFENKQFAAKSKLHRILITLFFTVNVAAVVYYEATDNAFNIYRTIYAGLVLLTYITYNSIRLYRKYYYIYLSDDYGKITVRFYPLRLVAKKYRAYEIPLIEFHHFEIIETFSKKQLILSRRKDNKIVNYPPISITALSANEIKSIKNILNQYLQNKK